MGIGRGSDNHRFDRGIRQRLIDGTHPRPAGGRQFFGRCGHHVAYVVDPGPWVAVQVAGMNASDPSRSEYCYACHVVAPVISPIYFCPDFCL
jgi:hypothetical protein